MKTNMRLGRSGILTTTMLSAALAFSKCGGETSPSGQDMMKPVDMGSSNDMTNALPTECNNTKFILGPSAPSVKFTQGTDTAIYALTRADVLTTPQAAVFKQTSPVAGTAFSLALGQSASVNTKGACNFYLCGLSGVDCKLSGTVLSGNCYVSIASTGCTMSTAP